MVGVGLGNRLNRPTTLHRGSSPKFTTFFASREHISFHSSPIEIYARIRMERRKLKLSKRFLTVKKMLPLDVNTL